MALITLALVAALALPALSTSPTFMADAGGNFVFATGSNASLIVNGIDILATLQSLQATVKAQQATINSLTVSGRRYTPLPVTSVPLCSVIIHD